MAKTVTKKSDKVEIKVGAETTQTVDVVISPSLRTKVAEIKDNTEKKLETQSEETEVKVVAPTKPMQTTKMVKVMLSASHRCHIGGEWYTFQANKQYNVPEQVKKILMQSGLLLPL